jgi:hypothetical protein
MGTIPQPVSETYTPPNWSDQPALYAITFRTKGTVQQTDYNPFGYETNTPVETLRIDTPGSRAGYNSEIQTNMFVFDALRRAQHRLYAVATQHPLQTGFNISDHVIMQPAQITLEVGMSDAIESYTLAGYTPMWTANPSKSVSAYQQMEALMFNRQLLTINTRLETYDNMVLIELTTEDTRRTYFGGLHMVLTFQQVFVVDVSLSYESARLQSTGETQQGTVQALPPSQTVIVQHKIDTSIIDNAPNQLNLIPGMPPGAGNYTSDLLQGIH